AHMNAPVPSLSALRSDIPEDVDHIFQKMMAKRPEDRYQQTSELVADLEALNSSGGEGAVAAARSDSKLNEFLKAIHSPAAKGSGTVVREGLTEALGNRPQKSLPRHEATSANVSAEVDTDPKSETSLPKTRAVGGVTGVASKFNRDAQRS